MSNESVTVEVVATVSPELVESIAGLLPQLSSATPPDLAQLAAIVEHDAITLLRAGRPDGTTIGILTLAMFPTPTGVRAWIEDVVVDERARGAGVASKLVGLANELARDAGARSIDLTSRPSREAANRLYMKLGFARRETNVYRTNLANE